MVIKNIFIPKSTTNYSSPEHYGGEWAVNDFSETKDVETGSLFSLRGTGIQLRAGEDLVKGNIVRCSRVEDGHVLKAGTTDGENGRDMPVGVVFEDCKAGSWVKIVTNGIARVLLDGTRSGTTGDLIITSPTISGAVLTGAEPEVPATANHWRECGHLSDTKTSGLAWAVIHFN